MSDGPVTLMMVDDDKIDTMAIRRSLRQLNVGNDLVWARDGVETPEKSRGENGRDKLSTIGSS